MRHRNKPCNSAGSGERHILMGKIRIVHKGLILVAVPLIFGIGFFSFLFSELLNTSHIIDREFLLKDAVVSHMSCLTASMCAISGKAMYIATQDQSWKNYYIAEQKRSIAADKHLRKLLKNEKGLEIPSVSLSLTSKDAGTTMTPLLQHLQAMSNDQSKLAKASIDSLRLSIWGGVLAGLVVSVLLAFYFCLNITNRLLLIMNNAMSLSQGTALSPPFKGSDEIAELNQLLYKSATEIRELERFKKEMVGVVSHELKSPLTSVGSFLSSLSAGVYGELTEKALDRANRTYASVKRLMGLIAELLYLDRLELEMNPEQIKVDDLLTTSMDTVNELSEKSGIEIKTISQGGEIYADRNRLVQVIVNLLSNAMKFSPKTGVVTLETRLADGLFECRVTDQGRGIPESFRKQIFEPFKQVDASDSTTKKGTGLGLTISRSIVEQHGGQIGVDSEEGKGSTFWFKIPVRMSSDRVKTVPDAGNKALVPGTKSGKIQSGKFQVLYQGLVIIALPLIFQIGFALVFNEMVNGLCKQTEQEDKSMKIINYLNRGTDCITNGMSKQFVFVYLPIPEYKNSWVNGKTRTLVYLNKVKNMVRDNPQQLKDVENVKQHIEELSAVFEREERTHESRAAFDKLDFGYRYMVHKSYGLKLKPTTPEDVTFVESGAQPNPLSALNSFRELSKDYIHSNNLEFLKLKNFLDRATEREKRASLKAARERTKMISTLEMTLISAIVATVVISTLIAFFLMRSITSRLQHIMLNTQRLAQREALSPPIAGPDEIALLDKILFEAGNRLMELETFKRELVSIVSHELRTPLLSISSALEMFSTGAWGELSDKGKVRLRFAQGEADRLIRLINDLLDIEKMEAGKFVLDFSEVKVADLIFTSTSAAAQLAEAKQIKLDANTNGAGTIFADKDRLSQVFINLLSNAIKYSPENGVIELNALKVNDEQIKFTITDQGRGIPEDLREKIFDRFVQVEKTDATERGGTGLGLAICKAIVEQHGGEIGVDSELGSGSTFWFKVPIRSSNPSGAETLPRPIGH